MEFHFVIPQPPRMTYRPITSHVQRGSWADSNSPLTRSSRVVWRAAEPTTWCATFHRMCELHSHVTAPSDSTSIPRGRVTETQILRGSGNPVCDGAVHAWARTTRWTKAYNGDEAVAVWIAQPFDFAVPED